MSSTEPQPTDALQYQGMGDPDVVDLMNSIKHREPIMVLRDTLTHRNLMVLLTEATGDPDAAWVVDPIDGRRKFTLAALQSGRFEPMSAKLNGSAQTVYFVAEADHRLYRNERARIE